MKKGILRCGHVQIRVLDMAEALEHYRDRLGLIEMNTDDQGRVYLKGWTECDKYSVILREADEAGMDFMGFKVDSDERLDALKQDLIDFGCEVDELPAGDLADCGRRMSFVAGTGHRFELFADKEQTGRWGVGHHNPEAWPENLKGMKATRLDHCLLYGEDLDSTFKLFTEVLGFWLTEQAMDGDMRIAQFFTCSMKEHEVAFIKSEGNTGAFHHASFYLESWQDVLHAADIISMHDISLDIGPTRHGLTHGATIYFFDPSGNRNETFCGGDYFFPDHPVTTWDAAQLGKAVFYHSRELNDRFLTVTT